MSRDLPESQLLLQLSADGSFVARWSISGASINASIVTFFRRDRAIPILAGIWSANVGSFSCYSCTLVPVGSIRCATAIYLEEFACSAQSCDRSRRVNSQPAGRGRRRVRSCSA